MNRIGVRVSCLLCLTPVLAGVAGCCPHRPNDGAPHLSGGNPVIFRLPSYSINELRPPKFGEGEKNPTFRVDEVMVGKDGGMAPAGTCLGMATTKGFKPLRPWNPYVTWSEARSQPLYLSAVAGRVAARVAASSAARPPAPTTRGKGHWLEPLVAFTDIIDGAIIYLTGNHPSLDGETWVAGSEGTSLLAGRFPTKDGKRVLYFIIPTDTNPSTPIKVYRKGLDEIGGPNPYAEVVAGGGLLLVNLRGTDGQWVLEPGAYPFKTGSPDPNDALAWPANVRDDEFIKAFLGRLLRAKADALIP